MKKLILSMLSVMAIGQAFAFNTVTVKDSISTNTTWSPGQQYLLQGFVYVTSGTTLTINKGTIIRGDKNTKGTLIIERGAKIIAEANEFEPIVFTSAQGQGDRSYGDWGGIIICGNAPTNWTAGEAQVEGGPRSKYGGTDANDNSGILRYVRIEFGGIAFSPNNEVNGLTLAGVGAGTQIDHVQVSYSGDDAYEWFGGNVNSKHLVSLGTWDDDFDTDAGYAGKNQFLFTLRDPMAADISGSKAFESDSYLAGTVSGIGDNSKATRGVFSNVTAMGPVVNPSSLAGTDPQYVSAVHLRRGSALSVVNSVFGGWPCGLLVDESSSSYGSTVANIQDNTLQFRSNIIGGIFAAGTPTAKEIIYVKDGPRNLTPTTANADTTTGTPFNPFSGPWNWLKATPNNNFLYASFQNGVRLWAPFNLTNPNPVPMSNSPIVYNSKALPAYMTAGGADPFGNGKLYPFNPTKAINTDTSNLFVNYNAPSIVPDFAGKASDAFFDKVNFIGAFPGTQTTSDNWMRLWTNFDPNNTNYEVPGTDINEVVAGNVQSVVLFPNPARQASTLSFDVAETADVRVVMIDLTGKVVKNMYEAKNATGIQTTTVDLSDVTPGVYFVTIVAGDMQKVVKLSVIK